jgi:membrane associated rhomboid family serine protease
MMKLFDDLPQDQAETYSLALASAGIGSELRRGEQGWELWTEDLRGEEAARIIRTYAEENRVDRLPCAQPGLQEYGKTLAGLWGAVILLVCYVSIFQGSGLNTYVRVYGASSGLILRGELYRCATALLLHADAVHLASNMLGIGIFATAVCSVTGWGVGWLMVVASGIAGNLMNAYFYKVGHLSIGASTAVFGAIGILSALQFFKKISQPGQRLKALWPFAAGVALLGFLGSSKNADLTAHLFGFFSGIILGALYFLEIKRPPGRGAQAASLLLVAVVLIAAWFRGF